MCLFGWTPPIPLQINPRPHSCFRGRGGVGCPIVGHHSTPASSPFVFGRYLGPTYRFIFDHGSLEMGKPSMLCDLCFPFPGADMYIWIILALLDPLIKFYVPHMSNYEQCWQIWWWWCGWWWQWWCWRCDCPRRVDQLQSDHSPFTRNSDRCISTWSLLLHLVLMINMTH